MNDFNKQIKELLNNIETEDDIINVLIELRNYVNYSNEKYPDQFTETIFLSLHDLLIKLRIQHLNKG
jgi:hypothetical protein